MLGFNPSLYNGKEDDSISLYGYLSFKRYLKLIGFNNPKNIKKVKNWKQRYPNMVVVI